VKGSQNFCVPQARASALTGTWEHQKGFLSALSRILAEFGFVAPNSRLARRRTIAAARWIVTRNEKKAVASKEPNINEWTQMIRKRSILQEAAEAVAQVAWACRTEATAALTWRSLLPFRRSELYFGSR
jgi:hypothetical protein